MSIELRRFIYLICCLITSYLFCYGIIKIQLSFKTRGQVERDFAMKSHIKKDGTPTMGGIAIILASLLGTLFYSNKLFDDKNLLLLIFVYFMYFLIGFIDDFLKIRFNSYEGLKGKYRLIYEILIVFLTFIVAKTYINKYSFIEIDLLDLIIPLGAFVVVLIVLIVVGISNSVNLTDGLDGLASGLMLIALVPFVLISIKNNEYNIAILLISTIGSLMAFLTFNLHPAKIFMGDCGSLSLGALISFCGVLYQKYIILFVSCSFFIFEAISVIIQVLYYKKTRKRIFLMAPFHHHLEKKGEPEWRIVMKVWLYGLICSFICLLIEVI